MVFLITFGCSVAACFILREPLRRWPAAFYALAVVFDILLLSRFVPGSLRFVRATMLFLLQKCYLPLSLFAVVMLMGVLPEGSKAKAWLRPIRAELSIIAWILTMGHMVVYSVGFLPRVFSGAGIHSNVTTSLVVAVILLVLLTILGITSLDAAKKRMRAKTWVRIQKLAYLFFALVYVHIMTMLTPAALDGSPSALSSISVYTALFAAYAICRVSRAIKDGRASLLRDA